MTGLPISTYFSAYKLKWLLDNAPAVAQAAAEGRALFGTVDSWLIWNMTGGLLMWHADVACARGPDAGSWARAWSSLSCFTTSAHHAAHPRCVSPPAGGAAGGGLHVTDASNASRTNLMDLRTLSWHEPTLRLFGVPPAMLPQIRSNAEVYGCAASCRGCGCHVPEAGFGQLPP